jgi:hypothetical protein
VESWNQRLYNYDCARDVWNPVYGNMGLLAPLFGPMGGPTGPFTANETKFPPKAVDCDNGTVYTSRGSLIDPTSQGGNLPPGVAVLESEFAGVPPNAFQPVEIVNPQPLADNEFQRGFTFARVTPPTNYSYQWSVTYMYKRQRYTTTTPTRTVACRGVA